jgi:hypothetical protein
MATTGNGQYASLSFICSDPQNIVAKAEWGAINACGEPVTPWSATRDLGPGPVDPALGYGDYQLTPGGQPFPLPSFYSDFRMMAQHYFDVSNGITLTIG